MAYLLGVVLFALAIFISVCLHEAGHMLTAKAFGMKVTRYFAGFGPTLWSFRRGETEYGLKGIPLGGFVKIVVITPLDDKPIRTYEDLQKAIRSAHYGAVTVTYQRDGQTMTTVVDLVPALRHPMPGSDGQVDSQQTTVPALGVGYRVPPEVPLMVTYGPSHALKESVVYSGRVFGAMGAAIGRIPQKVPALWASLSGKPRDPNTPMSVVGASRLGGETVEHGAWWLFLNILISLNFFIGVFNLLPLLPLDGGHIAIAFFERIRSWIYARLRRPDPGRVNYLRLMPFTYAVILVFGGFTLLTVAADIVNPITLFSR